MVLVVEGDKNETIQSYSLDDCCDLVDEKIKQGLSTKQAIKDVSLLTNVSKKDLYNYYHNEKGDVKDE